MGEAVEVYRELCVLYILFCFFSLSAKAFRDMPLKGFDLRQGDGAIAQLSRGHIGLWLIADITLESSGLDVG